MLQWLLISIYSNLKDLNCWKYILKETRNTVVADHAGSVTLQQQRCMRMLPNPFHLDCIQLMTFRYSCYTSQHLSRTMTMSQEGIAHPIQLSECIPTELLAVETQQTWSGYSSTVNHNASQCSLPPSIVSALFALLPMCQNGSRPRHATSLPWLLPLPVSLT